MCFLVWLALTSIGSPLVHFQSFLVLPRKSLLVSERSDDLQRSEGLREVGVDGGQGDS